MDAPLINGYYLDGNHDGGVQNSFNLAAYSFSRQNPVIYIDPDGNQFKRVDGGFWLISSIPKGNYGSNWGLNTWTFANNSAINIWNGFIGMANTLSYYGQSAYRGQFGNILDVEMAGMRNLWEMTYNTFNTPINDQFSSLVSKMGTAEYWESVTATSALLFAGQFKVTGAVKTTGIGIIASSEESILNMAQKNGIYSTQKGINPSIVDKYYNQMKNGSYKEVGAGGYKFDGKYYLNEDNHKMNAALKYGLESGDFKYVDSLINKGNWTPRNPRIDNLKTYDLPTK
ncbi:hypothetical protein ETU10_02950 [Apibacter muscae]|nr:hypothetical protein ETU10_02950 [Apibacter muscae]